ncbi:Bardet-Biedl syndrome 10 protein [Clarias gariepinus]|uniref:Bardet-Biedl syndrome 10 protein n=1 Tax=Clarias gariepinus TaxID=13013 RepID=UPI00234D4D0E|nr:Bardet-Biedl syndrome 10 protein [Clarias gariepinus]
MEKVSDALQVSLSVVGALECVVRRCVGPSGGTVIFTRDTGETLITKHGHTVLTTLHLEHPIARMVLECVCAHEGVTADGSKSFILLLAALLRGIRDSVHDSTHTHRRHAVRKLANQLHVFCWDGLDDVIAHGVVPYASSLFATGGYEPEGGVLAALVGGYIGGRVSPGQVDVLTPLLCELYTRVAHRDEDGAAISFINSNFSELHAAVSGLHSAQSRVVEGLLLACDWSVWKETDAPVKVLIVFEKLDALYDESVSVQLQEGWTVQSDRIIQERLAATLRVQVSIVLSAVKQSDRVLEWAWLNGVLVLERCDPGQLDLLCDLTAAETLTVQPRIRVGTLTHCRRVQLGGHKYANIGVTHTSVHVHTLVLCAPSAGPLEQSVSISRGVFSMLQHLSQSHRHNNVSLRPHQQRVVSTPPLTSLPSLTSPPPLAPPSPHSPCQNLRRCILTNGDVIPVGGAFEFLFRHSLLHSNHGDPESRRLLAEAVLSVPRSLHTHTPRDFLQRLVRFKNTLPQDRPIGAHGSGSEFTWGLGADGSGRVCVETVCSKHQLVASVLQCVNRLLRVETVIHTSRSLTLAALPEPGSDEDEDDDDDDDDDEM